MGEARAISRACSACAILPVDQPNIAISWRSLGRARGAGFAKAVGRSWAASLSTDFSEPISKLSFTRGRPDSETRKVKSPVAVAAASGGRIGIEICSPSFPMLLGSDGHHAVAYVLQADTDRIAAPQPGKAPAVRSPQGIVPSPQGINPNVASSSGPIGS
jgi:hypothetical protein